MENREVPREAVHFSFEYCHEDKSSGEHCIDAAVIDISNRGIRFETREKLPVGTKVKLNFEMVKPPREELLHNAEGMVVWSIQPNPDEALYRVGLKYL